MLKEMGNIKKRKSHRVKDTNCISCNCRLAVSDYMDREDYDLVNGDKTKIIIYCGKCGQEQEVKL